MKIEKICVDDDLSALYAALSKSTGREINDLVNTALKAFLLISDLPPLKQMQITKIFKDSYGN